MEHSLRFAGASRQILCGWIPYHGENAEHWMRKRRTSDTQSWVRDDGRRTSIPSLAFSLDLAVLCTAEQGDECPRHASQEGDLRVLPLGDATRRVAVILAAVEQLDRCPPNR